VFPLAAISWFTNIFHERTGWRIKKKGENKSVKLKTEKRAVTDILHFRTTWLKEAIIEQVLKCYVKRRGWRVSVGALYNHFHVLWLRPSHWASHRSAMSVQAITAVLVKSVWNH